MIKIQNKKPIPSTHPVQLKKGQLFKKAPNYSLAEPVFMALDAVDPQEQETFQAVILTGQGKGDIEELLSDGPIFTGVIKGRFRLDGDEDYEDPT